MPRNKKLDAPINTIINTLQVLNDTTRFVKDHNPELFDHEDFKLYQLATLALAQSILELVKVIEDEGL